MLFNCFFAEVDLKQTEKLESDIQVANAIIQEENKQLEKV